MSLRSPLFAAVLLGGLAFSAAVTADAKPGAPLHSEDAAAEAGRQFVATAAAGRIDEAFKLAAGLRRAADAEFAAILEAQQRELAATQPAHGTAGKPRLVETTHFGGTFVRWYYDVAYADGLQRWQLTFRHRSDGWFLNGVVIGWIPN